VQGLLLVLVLEIVAVDEVKQGLVGGRLETLGTLLMAICDRGSLLRPLASCFKAGQKSAGGRRGRCTRQVSFHVGRAVLLEAGRKKEKRKEKGYEVSDSSSGRQEKQYAILGQIREEERRERGGVDEKKRDDLCRASRVAVTTVRLNEATRRKVA
jgi:hypothetical protein